MSLSRPGRFGRYFLLLWAALLTLLFARPALAADWEKNFGTAGANAPIIATAVDSAGNTYVAGNFNGATLTLGATTLTRIGTTDAFVAKLDASGAVLWAKNYGGSGANATANGIAVDASGNVYLGGVFNSGNLTTPALTQIGNTDAFALKLDASGATTWAKNYGGSGASAYATGIAVDSSGNVYLGGYFTANLTTPALTLIGTLDAFALKLDTNGATTWAKNFGGSGATAYANGIAVDASGNVYLGGFFFMGNLSTPALTKIGNYDAFALKLDAGGAPTWSKNFGGSGANAFANAIAVDASGKVYLGGYFQSGNLSTPALTKVGMRDAFALKLDAGGATTWAKNVGGGGAYAYASAIAADASGNVYLGGFFNTANLSTPALTRIGSVDAFALKLDAGGAATWSKNFGGSGAWANANAIAVDASGNVYLGGLFQSANLSTPALTRIGTNDAFLIKQATPPSVSGLTPASGPTAGGTVVTVTGGNFSGATAVNFGANAGTALTVNSATSITVTTPAASAVGAVDVTVTTPSGTGGVGNRLFGYTPVSSYTGPPASGNGNVSASFTGGGAGCTYAVSRFVPASGAAGSPPAGTAPAGVSFPFGLFDFSTSGCTVGGTLTFTITYPQALPANTVYWKYGPSPAGYNCTGAACATAHWYPMPAAQAVISGNTITLTLTDGGVGDDDLTANGTLVDPGGPGVPVGGVTGVPTLSEWGMAVLAALLALFAVGSLRKVGGER